MNYWNAMIHPLLLISNFYTYLSMKFSSVKYRDFLDQMKVKKKAWSKICNLPATQLKKQKTKLSLHITTIQTHIYLVHQYKHCWLLMLLYSNFLEKKYSVFSLKLFCSPAKWKREFYFQCYFLCTSLYKILTKLDKRFL